MDARERAEKIAEAAWMGDGYTGPWCDADYADVREYTNIGLAAVRRAYEIDGVDKLVQAAEEFGSPIMDEDEAIDALERLLVAAARVREAIGGGE